VLRNGGEYCNACESVDRLTVLNGGGSVVKQLTTILYLGLLQARTCWKVLGHAILYEQLLRAIPFYWRIKLRIMLCSVIVS